VPVSSSTVSSAGAPVDNPADLAGRVRAALPAKGLSEQKMFGGIGFMLEGNMVAGASKRGLLLRVGKDAYGPALARPGVRPMDMRSRPVEGYIYVDPAVLDDATLREWLQLAASFVRTLPPKPPRTESRQIKGKRR
jgi:TfoX/Sxy family transcriptional regulator of competence genes